MTPAFEKTNRCYVLLKRGSVILTKREDIKNSIVK
jgi:hypothetical protein